VAALVDTCPICIPFLFFLLGCPLCSYVPALLNPAFFKEMLSTSIEMLCAMLFGPI